MRLQQRFSVKMQKCNTQYLQDDIVISGFSGRFPESDNVDELKKNLFEGVDMITDDERRWPAGIYGLPKRTGKLKDIQHFDATFFGVHAKQAHLMDPQLRILLEATYEAILDAGINPQEIRGSKTGVFVGVSTSESHELWTKSPEEINGTECGYFLSGIGSSLKLESEFSFGGVHVHTFNTCKQGPTQQETVSELTIESSKVKLGQ
ncbi:fatty acid synthase-like [Halictus rubicundus]|uniref:fatty acid synthase-like n=1 Tax=Halictus rubicundus TaxID=77578 RepID=UPI0040352515